MWDGFYSPNRIYVSAKAQALLLCLKKDCAIKDRELILLSGSYRESSTQGRVIILQR